MVVGVVVLERRNIELSLSPSTDVVRIHMNTDSISYTINILYCLYSHEFPSFNFVYWSGDGHCVQAAFYQTSA